MVDTNENNEELIDPGDGEPESADNPDPFAPPSPKASIFHTDDSEPDADSFSVPTMKSPWPGNRDNIGDTQTDEKYDYEIPRSKKKESENPLALIIGHPVVATIVISGIVIGLILVPRYSSAFWWLLLLLICYLPFARLHSPKWGRYHDAGWDNGIDRRGCLFGGWWW
jgi:hypothetical protein